MERYCPIIFSPGNIGAKSAKFYFADDEVEVNAPKSLVASILKTCNGERTIRQIIDILGKKWDALLVKKFVHDLMRAGILCNRISMSSYVWPFVKNPTRIACNLSDDEIYNLVKKSHERHLQGKQGSIIKIQPFWLQELIEQRSSIRRFSVKSVDIQIIGRLLWAGYGIVKKHLLIDKSSPQQVKVWQRHKFARHTVPSAGALYPLKLSLILLRPTEEYEAGIYNVNFRKPYEAELVLVNKNISAAKQSFADPLVCNNAQGVIIISGSFKITEEKYANRALLYVPLEAGHSAENIHLVATEHDVGTVEVGGFLEQSLQDVLGLPTIYWPLTSVVFGYQAEKKAEKSDLPSDYEIRLAPRNIANYKLPFSMAFAKSLDKAKEWACGRSTDPTIALSKAVSEAKEWSACGCIPDKMIFQSMAELKNAVDPRSIVNYHPSQYRRKHFPLKPFYANRKYYWTGGRNYFTGEKVFVLADCVYFPYKPKTPLYTYANSSGTAAYPNAETATRLAALEIIERDAFMIVWLNRLSMPRINFQSLPSRIQKRICALNKAGFEVIVNDFTIDLAPVIFIFAQNSELPITTCAASSSFDTEDALDHALMEVEAAAYCRLSNGPSTPIRPKKVRFTDDHGNIYEQREFFKKADFLAASTKSRRLNRVGKRVARNWEGLLDWLAKTDHSIITVDLSKSGGKSNDLHIIKAFIPGLVPMSFGYGVEPCGMKRIYDVPIRIGFGVDPASFGELEKFPHPYT